MATVKVPRETKLKHLPLETKVALRLVTLAQNKQKVAEMRPMAKELGVTFVEVMKAVESLAKHEGYKITPLTAASFEFELDEANRKALQLPASNFNKHLKVQAAKGGPRRPSGPPPTHLPPITAEQRVPWMEKATVLATKIGVPKLAFKVANCMVRIGEEEVNKLVKAVLEKQKGTEGDPRRSSSVHLFFSAYTARRNELVPALAFVPIPPHWGVTDLLQKVANMGVDSGTKKL
jgi:hypothetical protein